jgi:hypothetical protein
MTVEGMSQVRSSDTPGSEAAHEHCATRHRPAEPGPDNA